MILLLSLSILNNYKKQTKSIFLNLINSKIAPNVTDGIIKFKEVGIELVLGQLTGVLSGGCRVCYMHCRLCIIRLRRPG